MSRIGGLISWLLIGLTGPFCGLTWYGSLLAFSGWRGTKWAYDLPFPGILTVVAWGLMMFLSLRSAGMKDSFRKAGLLTAAGMLAFLLCWWWITRYGMNIEIQASPYVAVMVSGALFSLAAVALLKSPVWVGVIPLIGIGLSYPAALYSWDIFAPTGFGDMIHMIKFGWLAGWTALFSACSLKVMSGLRIP